MTEFRFLDLINPKHPNCVPALVPKLNRREPYWRPPLPKMYQDVIVPSWDWTAPVEPGTELIELDTNAAYVAALTSGDYAFNALAETGPRADPDAPGYYLIDTPAWNIPDLPSPLGTAELGRRVWVAQPTIGLCRSVAANGHMPYTPILDSRTSIDPNTKQPTKIKFRKWGEHIRDVRADLMDRLTDAGIPCTDKDSPDYKAVKDGYAIAVQMLTGRYNEETRRHEAAAAHVLRPDWYHTVLAQSAASVWRRAYNAWRAGHPPVAMSSPDQVTYTTESWQALLELDGRPVYPMDGTGKAPGQYKIKSTRVAKKGNRR